MERHLNESCADDLASSREALEERAGRGAAILSNISQLLHFISKDVDLQRIFQVSRLSYFRDLALNQGLISFTALLYSLTKRANAERPGLHS